MKYRELPELVGEPLGWDMFNVANSNGQENRIERAFLLHACNRQIDHVKWVSRLLLCVFTSDKHGKCVAFLEVNDMEGRVLSETVGIRATSVQYIRDNAWQAIQFLENVEVRADIPMAELHQLIESL